VTATFISAIDFTEAMSIPGNAKPHAPNSDGIRRRGVSVRGEQPPRGAGTPAAPAARDSGKPCAKPDAARAKPPGRVEFDSRGNSVWRWEAGEGDSTSILLKSLENDALQLEPTRPVPILGKRPVGPRPGNQSSVNPHPAAERAAGQVPVNGRSVGQRPLGDRAGAGRSAQPKGVSTGGDFALEETSRGGGFDPYNRG
jgi:hypothetical protein